MRKIGDWSVRDLGRVLLPILLLPLLVPFPSCTTIEGTIPQPQPRCGAGVLRAGAAKADITPPPGFPMGGHSVAGTTARGYWTRLFARAIYVEDGNGSSLVLVACDLWSVPAGLVDRVAEIVTGDPAGSHIGRERIICSGTHTHHSPGNFSSSALYNKNASRWPGFSRPLFEFLAQRIARAVLEATASAKAAAVSLNEARLVKLARNRSFDAFLRNPESREILTKNADLLAPGLQTSPDYPRLDAYAAVDPVVRVLRIESAEASGRIVAVAAFVPVHATSMANTTEVYHGDWFEVAATRAEQRLRRPDGSGPIVAVFAGAEGDISPNWEWPHQDRRDALRLGGTLCEGILDVLKREQGWTPVAGGSGNPAGDIRLSFDESSLRKRSFRDSEGRAVETARAPLPGVATLGGAEDGRTLFHGLGWTEGVKQRENLTEGREDHAPKLFALEPRIPVPSLLRWIMNGLADLVFDPDDVPERVPLAVCRLGPVVIATLPGEFTTVLGRRVRACVAQGAGTRAEHVVLVGLAGEYLSYFTTPEEYEAQHYEGASSLWGPHAGSLVAHELRALASRLSGGGTGTAPRKYCYRPGAGTSYPFGLDFLGPRPIRPDDGLENILLDLSTGYPVRKLPAFVWNDAKPVLTTKSDHRLRVTPRVAIEVRPAQGHEYEVLVLEPGIVESDDGVNFVTVALEAINASSAWCAFWMAPPEAQRAQARRGLSFRFRVETIDGRVLHSPDFRLPDP